jgi:hypothetical protein
MAVSQNLTGKSDKNSLASVPFKKNVTLFLQLVEKCKRRKGYGREILREGTKRFMKGYG